jgi:hypothetical protein
VVRGFLFTRKKEKEMGTFASSPPGWNQADQTVLTFEAGEAVTQRDLVEFGTTQGTVIACATANDAGALGFVLENAASGSAVRIALCGGGGAAEAVAEDGSVSVGNLLKAGTTTNDRVISAATTGTTAQQIVGRALTQSQTAGDVILVALTSEPAIKHYPALS